MTAPTGCHTCGGGAGRHDEAAHSDWPAEVDHRPYWNEVLEAEYCTGCGDDWPCLPHRETATLPPYSRRPITLPDGAPVIGWSGPATPTRPQRCGCGRPVPATSACGCHCAEHDHPYPTTARFDERYDPSPEPIERRIS